MEENLKDWKFEQDELINVKPSLLLIQIKLYTNSLNDSRFLSKISQYVSIEKDYIILERNFINEILKNKISNSSFDMLNIESVIINILEKNQKLEGIIFEVDDSIIYSRIDANEFQLKYKIIDYELKISCKYKNSIPKLGFVHFNKQLYWSGYFKNIPHTLTNLKGLETIFTKDTFEDNPRTIIKFNQNLFTLNKEKLLNLI
jgi:hypothetical protein